MQKKASKGMVDNALEKGAEVTLKAQQKKVPTGDTGRLKASLGNGKKSGSGTNRKIQVGIQNAKEREVTYGYYQEHGTRRMAGKKWMKTAWNDSIKEANEEIKKTIVKELKNK